MAIAESIDQWRKQLTSTVKRLRVTATSDPSRSADFADALVQLTAVRLQAWATAEAAAEAPESVVLAARILAAGGPVGPYAAPADATRYLTASAQLAAVQAGLGAAEAAGRTLAGLDAWREQLGSLSLADRLAPESLLWLLIARARAAFADPAQVNALADTAGAVRYLAPVTPNQAAAVHLLLADARWAAGAAEASFAQHRLAIAEVEGLAAELDPRPRPAVAQSLASMAAAVYEPFALRLEALGHTGPATAVRRDRLALLQRLGADTGEAAGQLAAALLRAGRTHEAAELGEPAEASVVPRLPSADARGNRGGLDPALSSIDPGAGYAALDQAEQAAMQADRAARSEAEQAEQRLQHEAEQRAVEQQAAAAAALEQAQAEAARAEAEQQRRVQADAAAAESRRLAEQERLRAEADQRRRQLAAAHARQADEAAAAAAAAELADARAAVQMHRPDPAGHAEALDRLAGLLRPLAGLDGPRAELAATLNELVSLRWQLGDADASREAARELKELDA